MRVRYCGPDDAVDVPLPGGSIRCPRGKWLDLEAEAAAVGVAAHHIPIVLRGLLPREDFESESPRKKREVQS